MRGLEDRKKKFAYTVCAYLLLNGIFYRSNFYFRSWEDEVLSLASTPSVPDVPRYKYVFLVFFKLQVFMKEK